MKLTQPQQLSSKLFFGLLKTAADAKKEKAGLPPKKEVSMKYKGIQIKVRTDGRYYARFKVENGVYKDVYGRTQQECYNKLKALVNSPKKLKKKEAPTTFGEFFEVWITQEKTPNCMESTLRGYRSKHKNYFACLDPRPIADITADEIRKLLLGIKSTKVASNVYIILSDIFRKAVQYEKIDRSVMDRVTAPKHREVARPAFTRDEERAFVAEAVKYDCAVMWFAMLYEGLRTSEARALAPCDILSDRIVVRHSLDDNGKLVPTKTKTVRSVPIFSEFKPYADKYRGDSATPILGKVNKHTGVKEYREIQKATGITKDTYSLRHTFVTRCVEAGISPKQIANWVGHSNITTTLTTYTNINSEFERENVTRKNAFDTKLTQN